MYEYDFTPVPFTRAAGKHRVVNRIYQGIPSITITPGGRLFALWFGDGPGEAPENYIMIALSDDKGRTWTEEQWVVDPPSEKIRAFDASIFTAPDGSVHCFWAQNTSYKFGDIFDGRNGVWHSKCANPDDPPENFRWSLPERICDGVMVNPPIVLASGEWALPVALWWKIEEVLAVEKSGIKVYISKDNGQTFQYRGGVEVPEEFSNSDEPCIYELSDGRLGLLIRRFNGGYYESFSSDLGKNWTPVDSSPLPGVCARGYIGRLKSGRLLAITNDSPSQVRRNLTAFLSDDNGQTWKHKLRLDLRDLVSYPNAVQDDHGFIYIIYDHDRYGCGDILCTRITEADIEAGVLLNDESFAGKYISRLFATHNEIRYGDRVVARLNNGNK